MVGLVEALAQLGVAAVVFGLAFRLFYKMHQKAMQDAAARELRLAEDAKAREERLAEDAKAREERLSGEAKEREEKHAAERKMFKQAIEHQAEKVSGAIGDLAANINRMSDK